MLYLVKLCLFRQFIPIIIPITNGMSQMVHTKTKPEKHQMYRLEKFSFVL